MQPPPRLVENERGTSTVWPLLPFGYATAQYRPGQDGIRPEPTRNQRRRRERQATTLRTGARRFAPVHLSEHQLEGLNEPNFLPFAKERSERPAGYTPLPNSRSFGPTASTRPALS